MKASKLRFIVPAVIMVLVGVGFATRGGIGTLSAFGWQDVSLLCPLGALGSMFAAKTMIPRALVSLAIAIVLIVLVGKAFCAWVCPVPLVSKLRGAFSKRKQASGDNRLEGESRDGGAAAQAGDARSSSEVKALTEEELRSFSGCSHGSCSSSCVEGASAQDAPGCSSCAENRKALSSRHYVLGGSLLSAAIFGFPVFCLVCPIGLTFASILLIMRLFTDGDMTWAVVVVPALLLAEVVFFRKWCHAFCPLGAFMSLIAKVNRTLQPIINKDACLESTRDAQCGKCTEACPEGINLRDIANGEPISECTRCRSCVEACPSGAISMPLLAKGQDAGASVPKEEAQGEGALRQ